MRHLAVPCLVLQLFLQVSSALDVWVVHGSTLILPCLPVQGDRDFTGAVITWKHNGVTVPDNSSKSVTTIKDDFYLSISPVTAANKGEYVCTLEENNMEWMKEYTVRVDVSTGYTLKAYAGSTINLPCHRPTSSEDDTYARWSKEKAGDEQKQLAPVELSTPGERLEWLYADPLDTDQTITLKELITEDSGVYHCESAEGENFNTIQLIVEVAPTIAPHSCSGFTTAWEPCQDEDSRSWAPMLEESMAAFSQKLYSYLRQSQSSKNLLYSPISISMVLSHLLLGARGDTRRDIEGAISVPHDFRCIHLQMKKLKERLLHSLQIASQIYYNPYMNLSESFTNQSVQFYEAEPTRLLDTDEANTAMINSWVAEKTNNKITQLVQSVPAHTQLMLLNAVSFKGQWMVKFDSKAKKAQFTKLNGDIVMVPVLYSSKYSLPMAYVPEVMAKVVKLALSGESSLYILLPQSHKQSGLQGVEERLTDTAVRQMIAQLKAATPQTIEVTLPKLKLDIQVEMNSLLRKLGLSSLFDDPNLCGLYSEDKLSLTDSRHRAFLTLNEEGVEAGAATSISFSRSFSSFSALRPFILLLWSDQANVPLFVGRVTEP